MYENVQKEKEVVVGKMAALEVETRSIREQLASSQERCAASAKVCMIKSLPATYCLMLVSCHCNVVSWGFLCRRMRSYSQWSRNRRQRWPNCRQPVISR